MSSRALLFLTVTVALLGAFIYFVERDLPSTDERADQAKKVLSVDEDEVRTIEISWQDDGDETVVRLERQDEPAEEAVEEMDKGEADEDVSAAAPEWRLVEPLAARADASLVDALLSSLEGLEKDRTLERSEAALGAPRGRVTLSTGAGDITLEIGEEVPGTSGMLVALAGGSEVYQVSSAAWDELIRAPGEWRDPRLFPFSRPDIDRLTLRSPTGQVLLARRGAEFWVESPLQDLADEDRVNGLLNEITGLEADRFVDAPPPLEELGLAAPDRVVEAVITGREEPFRLTLGAPVGGADEGKTDLEMASGEHRYARVDGQVVEIDTRLAAALERPAEKWRSRAWTPLQVFEIDAVRFTDGAGELELVREEGQWRRDGERIDYSTASDALYALADVDAAEVVSATAAAERGHDLVAPVLEIVLESGGIDDEEGVKSQTLRLYRVVDGMAAAIQESRDAVLLVAEENAESLRAAVEEVRAAQPLKEEEEAPSQTDE